MTPFGGTTNTPLGGKKTYEPDPRPIKAPKPKPPRK